MPSVSSLDAKDRAILYCLDKDARQSNSLIAKKTRLSKEVVNYRIKVLLKNGIIQNFYTIIDSSRLGYMVYRIFIGFQNVDMEKESEIIDYLKSIKSVGWVVSLEEMYDLAILIWAKNVFEFKDVYDEIMTKYGCFFQKSFVTIVMHIHHFINNHLFETEDLSERVIGGRFVEVPLDAIDLKVLSLLAKDARIPLLTLANETKVSPNTVKQRIKKMKEKKIIVGFKAKINSSILGYQHYKILLQLTDVSPNMKLKLREYLKLNRYVTYVTEAIGRADLEFEIQVKSGNELRQHVRDLRQYFGGSIKEYKATLVSKEEVIDYFPRRCSV